VFSGADAFKLYDTYGFPIDLTKEMAADVCMSVDEAAFAALMQEQRERARAARAAAGESAWAGIDLGLDNSPTVFTGYGRLTESGKVLAIVAEDELRERVGAGAEALLVLDRTPFYAEMGGQAADRGSLICGDAVLSVTDVQRNKAGKYLHYGLMKAGSIAVGDTVTACVDTARRRSIMRAHTATHLLHKALRTVLGDHVKQAGSLVEPDHLRFDFTHFSAMTPEELEQTERLVNEAVLEGYGVCTNEMALADARAMGATALFGEKYGAMVRVVDMGEGYSMELCGGTHLDSTAKVGSFRIQSEFSVASGVRRIEAVTGFMSLREMEEDRHILAAVAGRLKSKPAEIPQRTEAQQNELRELRQKIEKYKDRELLSNAERYLKDAVSVGGLKVLTVTLPDIEVDAMRKIGDFFRDKEESIAAVIATVREDKLSFLAVCGKKAVAAGVRAGDLIRQVSAICGGKGGGKPDSAMGGGTDVRKLEEALASVRGFVEALQAK
jgi:alanyl-tRNA synthetase